MDGCKTMGGIYPIAILLNLKQSNQKTNLNHQLVDFLNIWLKNVSFGYRMRHGPTLDTVLNFYVFHTVVGTATKLEPWQPSNI